jgi:hypothetical protein
VVVYLRLQDAFDLCTAAAERAWRPPLDRRADIGELGLVRCDNGRAADRSAAQRYLPTVCEGDAGSRRRRRRMERLSSEQNCTGVHRPKSGSYSATVIAERSREAVTAAAAAGPRKGADLPHNSCVKAPRLGEGRPSSPPLSVWTLFAPHLWTLYARLAVIPWTLSAHANN